MKDDLTCLMWLTVPCDLSLASRSASWAVFSSASRRITCNSKYVTYRNSTVCQSTTHPGLRLDPLLHPVHGGWGGLAGLLAAALPRYPHQVVRGPADRLAGPVQPLRRRAVRVSLDSAGQHQLRHALAHLHNTGLQQITTERCQILLVLVILDTNLSRCCYEVLHPAGALHQLLGSLAETAGSGGHQAGGRHQALAPLSHCGPARPRPSLLQQLHLHSPVRPGHFQPAVPGQRWQL